MAAALATLEGPAPEQQANEVPAVTAPTPDPAPAVDPQAQPPAAATPVVAAPPAPSAKELERIAALDAREARIREAEAKQKQSAAPTFDWDSFVADPVEYVRKARPDLSPSEAAQVAEKFYFTALGDKAPLEHRTKQEVAKLKTQTSSEVEALRAKVQELEARELQKAQAAEVASYKSELASGAVAAAAEAPLVASLAQRNPTRAQELLFEVARRAAIESQQRGDAEPVVLTPVQAAAKLQAYLEAQRAEYEEIYGTPKAATQTQPNVQQAAPSPTISNRDASIQPSRVAPDALDDKALRKAALEAAGFGHIVVWD